MLTKYVRLLCLSLPCRYGVASTYYGISLNIAGFGLNIYLTHFIYSAIEIPAKLIIYFCLNSIGRRHCQTGTLLLTGTCIAINIVLPKGYLTLNIKQHTIAAIGISFS